jgi:hypothetical protein
VCTGRARNELDLGHAAAEVAAPSAGGGPRDPVAAIAVAVHAVALARGALDTAAVPDGAAPHATREQARRSGVPHTAGSFDALVEVRLVTVLPASLAAPNCEAPVVAAAGAVCAATSATPPVTAPAARTAPCLSSPRRSVRLGPAATLVSCLRGRSVGAGSLSVATGVHSSARRSSAARRAFIASHSAAGTLISSLVLISVTMTPWWSSARAT